MNRIKIDWRNSIFTRLMLTFFIMLIPLYILGIQIFKWSKDMLSGEILTTMNSQVEFLINSFDNDISKIQMLQFEFFNNEDLTELVYSSELLNQYEKSRAILRLQQQLTTVKNSSLFIEHICIHIPSENLTIYNSGHSRGSVQDFDTENSKIFETIENKEYRKILYYDNRLLLIALSPYFNFKEGFPPFYIEVELSEKTIQDVFVDSTQNNAEKNILFTLEESYINTNDSDIKNVTQILDLIEIRMDTQKKASLPVQIQDEKYLLIYVYSDYSGVILSRYIPENVVFRQLSQFRIWYWFFSILAVVIIILFAFSTFRIIFKPLIRLIDSFREVREGNFDVRIHDSQKNEFGYLYSSFNKMISEIKTLINQVYKHRILEQKAELKQLQSQINPHFLYNSFFVLRRRIKRGEYESAEKFSENLGMYFKYITRNSSDFSTLEKEVEHARIYSDIQANRFKNRIKVQFQDLPKEFYGIEVPRLIIQPIIENAFEHGLEEKLEDGILRIYFTHEENFLKIIIEDNGEALKSSEIDMINEQLLDDNPQAETTGIINIHRRLQLSYSPMSGINATRSELGGLKVTIILDLGSVNHV